MTVSVCVCVGGGGGGGGGGVEGNYEIQLVVHIKSVALIPARSSPIQPHSQVLAHPASLTARPLPRQLPITYSRHATTNN